MESPWNINGGAGLSSVSIFRNYHIEYWIHVSWFQWVFWWDIECCIINCERHWMLFFQLPTKIRQSDMISRGIIWTNIWFASPGGLPKGFNNGVGWWQRQQWFPTRSRWRRFWSHKLFCASYEVSSTFGQFIGTIWYIGFGLEIWKLYPIWASHFILDKNQLTHRVLCLNLT